MGCDIHLYAEIKLYQHDDKGKQNGVWVMKNKMSQNQYRELYRDEKEPEIDIEKFYLFGRNYNLFAALAGVRSYYFRKPVIISQPKGMPDDASKFVSRECEDYGSDGHSHSFLTLKELKDFDWSPYGNTVYDFVTKTIPSLEELKYNGATDDDVRIVFWFDN